MYRLGNHFGKGKKISKPDMCLQIGAVMLIDDSLKYTTQCSKVMDHVILFDWNNKYGWNKSDSALPKNVHRLTDWNAIYEFLARL